MSCAGSVYLTLVDACKGFNQIVNTDRARQMLAILARSGQFLPRCLTFGPSNGPEDFAFATDRVFAPGEGRKRWFCDNWQIYADDITLRTGRVLSGVLYTDEEYRKKVDAAKMRKQEMEESEGSAEKQMVSLDDALRVLGFGGKPKERVPTGPGQKERSGKPRTKTEGEASSSGLTDHSSAFQSPIAHQRLIDAMRHVEIAANTFRLQELTVEEPLRRLTHHEVSLILFAEAIGSLTELPGNPESPDESVRSEHGFWDLDYRRYSGADWGRRPRPAYNDPRTCSLGSRIARLRHFGGPARRCYDEWPDRADEITIVLAHGIGPYPHSDPLYTPWECGVCFNLLGTEWWICPL